MYHHVHINALDRCQDGTNVIVLAIRGPQGHVRHTHAFTRRGERSATSTPLSVFLNWRCRTRKHDRAPGVIGWDEVGR